MDSATIVSAALDSKQLEDSINKLVATVASKTKEMADNFTKEVGRMEQAVKNLGNIKIDSGGTADGGSSRRAKMLSEESLKAKEVAMTYDQMQAAFQRIAKDNSGLKDIRTFNKEELQSYIDLLRKLQAEYVRVNTQEGGGAKSDQIKRDMAELEKIIQGYQVILKNVEMINSRQGTIDVKKWTQDIGAVDDRYKKLVRWYTVLEKEDQRRIANEEKANQKRLAELEKEQNARQKMIESARKAEEKYQNSVLKTAFNKIIDMPSNNIDQMRTKLERLQTILANIRELGILSPKDISNAETEIGRLRGNIQQIEKIEKERIAAERQFIIEQQKEIENLTTIEGRVKSLSQATKQYFAENKGEYWRTFNAYGKDFTIYNPEKSNRANGLSIEEQITNILKEEKAAREGASQAAQQQANSTQNVAKAQQEESAAIRKNFRDYDTLRQAIASVIGVKTEDVRLYGVEISSINQLSDKLKQLRSVYNQLGTQDRHSERGKELINQIQNIERQMDRARKELSRPIDLKSALGTSEKTLDDIAYKMQRLASYRSGLNVGTQREEINTVNQEYDRLKKKMDEVLQKNNQMIASNNALGRSWNYMKNRLAFYFTVGASTQFIRNLIEVRSQYEMNERALGILVNSAERGTQIFNELSQMALVSPYTLIELSAAAKQLTAYDVAAKDVVDTTRRLADMAAAVGIPIERLTYALGQIKAYGYLNARDARMFANAGIPLVKQLSEYYTELEGHLVSTADIYDRIKKKSIGYEEVTSVIARMTDEGGKFYDFQAKMAETLKVQLANLTLAWNNMLNAMGEESQGVLVGGINALKQMFLHWKDIEHILYEIVVALGAYKAYQIITTRLMGATSASLDSQILALKRNKAAMLERQALTQKLTYEETRLIATQKQVTAADYMNALSGKQLSKQKALMLVAFNKNNVALKAAIANMGLLTTQEITNITMGKALAIVFKSIGISIKNAALAIRAFAASMWPLLVVGAIYELYHAWDSYGEHVKEVNKQASEHAKEAFDNIKQYLDSETTINTRQRVVYKEGNPLNDSEGQKAWDEMREKIELSSSASNTFVAKLMQIDNINHRLAAGFDYLKDIQRVAGVMQTLEEDAIKVSSTSLGGLFGEGLKDDLTDFIKAYQKYISLNENLRQSGIGEEYFNDQKKALEEFRGEIEKTTTSLYGIVSKEGFNTNEQREFLEREISEIAQAEQMGAKETRIFRMQAEKEYYAYARAQLVAQLEYQQGVQKAATEERIKDLDTEFGSNKAMQESFFTWLTEKQDHEVKNMLRGKTQEEIAQGEWLKGANAKWVEEMARKFSKEYGVSFDDLHRLVLNANTWSINIPVFFQTIGQPLSDIQRDYEARTGKKFSNNPIIKDAKTQVEILDILKKKQKEVASEMETARNAGGKYWEDNKQRYEEENNALVADIHAYNALTDAEEKANKKNNKGSKKDELLDALKQEISLVEKLQSDYDKLEKSGASQTDALDTIRVAYGKTIRLLNTQLSGFGLPQINISELITGKDPNKALAHFKQTLNTLVSKGMLTLERSKELEAVIEKFTLSAKTYNLDKITKGLNNELDRLKDEYELAVSLDADPELGSMFADWMGIDMNDLPRTAQEYAKRYTDILNGKLKEYKANIVLPNLLTITDKDLRDYQDSVGTGGITQKYVDDITKGVKSVRDIFKKEKEETSKDWNALIEKYGGLQAKLLKIYKDNVQQQASIVREFGTNDEQIKVLDLVSKIKISQDPAEIARLQEELAKVMNDVVSRNPTALKTYQSVQNEQESLVGKAYWDNFKDSDLYSMTFTDMANNSTQAIQMIIDKLNGLKDKVKEDPASMKALIKSLEDAESELLARDPFKGISNSIGSWVSATKEQKVAQKELEQANIEVAGSEIALKNAQSVGDKEEIVKAEQKLAQAQQKQAVAQGKVVQSGNKAKKAQEQLKTSFQNLSNELGNVNGLLGSVAQIFREVGDDDTADAIEAINQGFTIMTSVISAVTAALTVLQSSNPWLLAMAAALSVIVGLVSFLSGSSNKNITEQVEKSERSVKRLELAYVDLQQAVDKAYGTAVIGAKRVALANKELQLAEIKRQITLERSRTGKYRDEDKIIDLQKQYKELFYEIKNGYTEMVDDLMGTDVGSFAENLVSSMIDSFKQGEDYMKVFGEKFDEMIDNMIMKAIVSRVVSQYLDAVWNDLNERISSRSKNELETLSYATKRRQELESMDLHEYWEDLGRDFILGDVMTRSMKEEAARLYEQELAYIKELERSAQETYDASSAFTGSDIDYVMQRVTEIMPELGEKLQNILGEYYKFGESSETQLSALQQGIQGITEDTAGALEAYMNGVSQQVYYQSDLLTQIRDAVVGFNLDVQVASMSQILLQLRSSYEMQTAIHSMLEGWSSPNGMSVRVEMV